MTAPKSSERGVRRTAGGAVKRLSREEVDDLLEFFEGRQGGAWALLLPGYESCREEIIELWRQWEREHPNARPPSGYEKWLVAGNADQS